MAARPSPLAALGVTAGASVVWFAATVYGFYAVDMLWGIAAALAGVAVLVLTLRAFPVVALLPAVLGVLSWGLVARAWLPSGFGDILGVLRFVGAILLYAVPLLIAYLSAVDFDGRRELRARVAAATAGRRWWARSDDSQAALDERPALVRSLEAVPSARFFVLAEGPATHLVAGGRHVALVHPTTWPPGDYQMTGNGQIIRDGRPFPAGTQDVDALSRQVRGWLERLDGTGASCRGYLLVQPPRDGGSGDIYLTITPGDRLHIVHVDDFVEAAGAWLAAEPYRLDIHVMERLLEDFGHLPPAEEIVAAGRSSASAPRDRSRSAHRRSVDADEPDDDAYAAGGYAAGAGYAAGPGRGAGSRYPTTPGYAAGSDEAGSGYTPGPGHAAGSGHAAGPAGGAAERPADDWVADSWRESDSVIASWAQGGGLDPKVVPGAGRRSSPGGPAGGPAGSSDPGASPGRGASARRPSAPAQRDLSAEFEADPLSAPLAPPPPPMSSRSALPSAASAPAEPVPSEPAPRRRPARHRGAAESGEPAAQPAPSAPATPELPTRSSRARAAGTGSGGRKGKSRSSETDAFAYPTDAHPTVDRTGGEDWAGVDWSSAAPLPGSGSADSAGDDWAADVAPPPSTPRLRRRPRT